jgi:hypothetical protein
MYTKFTNFAAKTYLVHVCRCWRQTLSNNSHQDILWAATTKLNQNSLNNRFASSYKGKFKKNWMYNTRKEGIMYWRENAQRLVVDGSDNNWIHPLFLHLLCCSQDSIRQCNCCSSVSPQLYNYESLHEILQFAHRFWLVNRQQMALGHAQHIWPGSMTRNM